MKEEERRKKKKMKQAVISQYQKQRNKEKTPIITKLSSHKRTRKKNHASYISFQTNKESEK